MKNNYTGYHIPDLVSRISECEDLDEQCDNVTRISIICTCVLSGDTKQDVLELLLKYTSVPLAFYKVKKIYLLKLDEDPGYIAIEWFFEKHEQCVSRRVLARTLIHIAHTLWRQYNKAILYPDAIQRYGGHRSSDIHIDD